MADAAVTVQVEGAKEVRTLLRSTGDKELPKALRDANKTVSQLIVDAVLPNVPVHTGRLKASVKALATQTTAYGKAGSARVPYAPAVHWGTGPRTGQKGPHNIRRRPFLLDAATRVKDRAVKQYEDAIQDLFNKAVRS